MVAPPPPPPPPPLEPMEMEGKSMVSPISSSSDSSDKIPIAVWFSSTSSKPERVSFAMDSSATFKQLEEQIVKKLDLSGQEEFIKLVFVAPKIDFNAELLEKKIEEVSKKFMIQVQSLPGLKAPVRSNDSGNQNASTTTIIREEVANNNSSSSNIKSPSPSYSSTSSAMIVHPSSSMMSSSYTSNTSSWSSYNNNEKQKSGYVGLGNQGATCYMNSLIQTLFMTPEFRSTLYRWNFETYYENWKEKNNSTPASDQPTSPKLSEEENRIEREKKSIPRQLQLLFARLQTAELRAAKTKDLTNSFGWKDSDAFTQHDVQELCRVLFDALESVLKGTKQENFINELYQGEMKDYVTCSECGNESSRTDKYLDIPLVIKGFGEEKAISSIEEALQKFVTPEELKEDNQYNCEKCGKKVNAKKGLKFTSFPYLLTLQLKRFDFDYSTMRRKKLNDRVTFPHILDLNGLIGDESASREHFDESKELTEQFQDLEKDEKENTNDSEKMQEEDKDLTLAGASNSGSSSSKMEEQPSKKPKNYRKAALELVQRRGKYVYELYSVLIHRGSALGGHYYAYIKSFTTGKWYEFNDSSVNEIEESAIENTFGEEEKKGSYFNSSANAYMLMYRRVDEEKNTTEPTEIPPELKERLEEEQRRQEEKARKEELKKNSLECKIYLYRNGKLEGEPKEISISKSQLSKDSLEICRSLFEETKDLPLERMRFRKVTDKTDKPEVKNPVSGEDTLNKVAPYNDRGTFAIEVREEDGEFDQYDPDVIQIRVWKPSDDGQSYEGPHTLKVNTNNKLEEQIVVLSEFSGIPMENIRVVKPENYGNGTSIVYPPRLSYWSFKESEKYFLEDSSKYPDEKDSVAIREILKETNKLSLKLYIFGEKEPIIFPCSKKDTIKKLREGISEKINVPVDQFKLIKGLGSNWPQELKQEDKILDYLFTKEIWVEKGQPTKDGEDCVSIFKFDPISEIETDKPLFEMIVNRKSLVSEVKVQLANRLKQENIEDHNPEHIRLIEISNYKRGSTVYPDKLTFDLGYNSVPNKIGYQLLDGPEPKDEKDDTYLLFARRFNPSTLTFGEIDDLVLTKKSPSEEVKKHLAEKYNIEEVSLARDPRKGLTVTNAYDVFEEAKWDASGETSDGSTLWTWACEGDVLYWKDKSEKDMELDPEEKKKYEAEKKKRMAKPTYYRGREEALKINTSDN